MSMRKALLIANTKYKNLDNLTITENDVLSLKSLLEDRNYGNFDVVKPVIDEINIQNINNEIFEFYNNCNRDDFLLFYYSGHGILDNYSEFYIAMNDYQEGKEPTTAYPIYNICNYMKRYSRANAKAVILDCCYSGAITESFFSTSKSSNSTNINSYFLGTGTSILTSSKHYQLSHFEKDDLNSKFTKLMIEGIKSGKADYSNDGIIDFKGLHRYISEKIDKQNPQLFENLDRGSLYISQNPNIFSEKYKKPYNENFVFIKGGTFEMGSPEIEVDRSNNELLHTVKLDDFYIEKYVVTIEQFEKFINETNYKTAAEQKEYSWIWDENFKKGKGLPWKCDASGKTRDDKQHPAIRISWNDAKEYCKWLSAIYNVTYRLPTEAEWEYACRAGTNTPFNTGNKLTKTQANFANDTKPVGSYPANKWGLYDMHGNVWEWCEDLFDKNYYKVCKNKGIVENPNNQEKVSYRVVRGGSWLSYARFCRSAYRSYYDPDSSSRNLGFRVVFVP